MSCCSVAKSCLTLFNPTDYSVPDFPVLHYLLELVQTYVHRFGDAIQPSHPLSSASPPALTLSQYQSLFQWVSSSHQVSKVLELQLQHQSFQGTASPHPQLLFSHLGSPAIASWDLCLLQNCRKKIWEGDRQGLLGVGGPAALASLLAGLSEFSKLLRPGTLESLWRFQQGRGDTCCSFWLLWKHLLWLVFCYL